MMRIAITGGRLIDPANGIDEESDLYLVDGKVAAVGAAPDGFTADATIDATGKVVCPGLIDLRARLREPGFEYKATLSSETAAAAASGITTLVCPPDTQPVIDTPAVAEMIQQRAARVGKARVLTVGALTNELGGKTLTEMLALKKAGCVGVGNAYKPVSNTLVMRRAMEYAASHDLTVFLYAEDPWLRGHGCAHEGALSTRMGLDGIPEIAETVAVARDLALIEQTGVRAHFCQLSSSRAVRQVARARFDGLAVSADVTAHHLHLTEMDLAGFNVDCHVRPPLREQRDRDGLRAGLKDGTLAAICSDHQPHDVDAKLGPFAETEPGLSGLETLLPLTLRLVDEKVLDLSEALALLTCKPAEVLGLDSGHLAPGAVADVCVFGPQSWRLQADAMLSRGRNTPFLGWEFDQRVTHTLLEGHLVHGKFDT